MKIYTNFVEFSDTINSICNHLEEEVTIIITTPIIVTAIIGFIFLILGFVTKKRWLHLIALIIFLILVWFIIREFFYEYLVP